MVLDAIVSFVLTAGWYVLFAAGATLSVYPVAVLVGGGANRGEEDAIAGQMFLGILILGILFL